jgi:hypothetical protein
MRSLESDTPTHSFGVYLKDTIRIMGSYGWIISKRVWVSWSFDK